MHHTDMNVSIPDEQYKDCSPLATVERIRSILKENNIETEETWFESGVPYCYSLKVKVPGTTFRTIGKGLTKELAIASGYGEFIERLQLGIIYGPTSLKDGDYAVDDARYELVPAKTLLDTHRVWYERMSDVLYESTGKRISAEQVIGQCTTKDGLVSVTPYLDLATSEKVYFPTVLRKRVYGSNGCAAGNTPEEALVQAISEIVERSHQIHIVKEGLALPEIPEEELKKYHIASEIIQFVRNNGYIVSIRDASMNTGFPVVCAYIIDQRTGRYHTHFGAHPVFEIALERSLTESFQGRNIEDIADIEDFTPKCNAKFTLNDFYTELRQGCGTKVPEFFVGDSPFSFDPNMGVSECGNKEILRFCKDFFTEKGYPLLVRDCSCLGFPTYQVIVPGYSECYINRISSDSDDQRYAPYAISTLRNPSKATLPDMMGMLMHLERIKSLDSGFRDVHNFCMMIKVPSDTPIRKQNDLLAASLGFVYYSLGQYGETVKCIAQIIPHVSGADLDYLICLKRYLSLLAAGYDTAYARRTIDYFHSPETVHKLLTIFAEKRNPLDEYVLHCDGTCHESCQIHSECFLKRVDGIAAILEEKSKHLNFDEMATYLRHIL